jgi:uncharacterized membrane protein
LSGIIDFINRNYIDGIINDTSYNHFDMITYIIVLFAGIYAVLHLLNRLKIKVDEDFVMATIPYIFLGSVFRVIEDADMLKPPLKYFFITPLIYFVIFAISFGILLSTRHLEKIGKIKNYLQSYAYAGMTISVAAVIVLAFNSYKSFNLDVLLYSLVLAVALSGAIIKLSPFIGMVYLRSRVYSFVIFSFLLDAFTTYIGVDLLGYVNKHPFSSLLASVFGTDAAMIPLSAVLALLIIFMLERESGKDKKEDEKYILILTLIVLGFSMGVRNLLAISFGV